MNNAATKPAAKITWDAKDADATWRQLEARREAREARNAAIQAREDRRRGIGF